MRATRHLSEVRMPSQLCLYLSKSPGHSWISSSLQCPFKRRPMKPLKKTSSSLEAS